jgi:Tfp pilus assembly protein PilN
MRAVNLIPSEQRRGAGGVAGRAGGVAYVLIGTLVALVIMAVVYAVATKQAADSKSKIATVSAQADVAQAQANSLQPYVQFATLSQQRKQSVASIADARFNWSGAMDQIARALPADVTLTSLTGTSGTTASAAPASASTPSAAGGPSFDFNGCATSHPDVALALVNLRKIEGVTGVTLSSSQKTAATTGAPSTTSGATGAASSGGSAGCPRVSFHGIVTYSARYTVGAPAITAGNGPVPAVAASAPAVAQPVATTTAVGR